MSAILPSTLGELPSSAARLFEEAKGLIESKARELDVPPSEVWITQRNLREHTGLGHELVKKNLRILVDWEYLRTRGSARGVTKRYGLNSAMNQGTVERLPSPQIIEKKVGTPGPSGSTGIAGKQIISV